MNNIRFQLTMFLCVLIAFFTITGNVQAASLYTNDNVNMRTKPSKEGSVIMTIEAGKKVAIYGYEGDWADVEYNGKNGYVRKDFLSENSSSSKKSSTSSGTSSKKSTSDKSSSKSDQTIGTAKITAEDVNFRVKPKGEVIRKMEKGERISILSKGDDWSKVKSSTGEKGYIYNSYISHMVSRSDKISEYREKAVKYCKDHLEDKYSQDKRDEAGYCDCSSLMRDAFKEATGEMIGVNTVDQTTTMDKYLYKIKSIEDVKVGDIVYHLSGKEENHCGIYIGDGAVINASFTVGKVKISYYDSTSKYWEYACRAASFCYDEKY